MTEFAKAVRAVERVLCDFIMFFHFMIINLR